MPFDQNPDEHIYKHWRWIYCNSAPKIDHLRAFQKKKILRDKKLLREKILRDAYHSPKEIGTEFEALPYIHISYQSGYLRAIWKAMTRITAE